MKFEWDEDKRISNINKHGIDFADVWIVFDYDIFTIIDDRFDYGKIRYFTLGIINDTFVSISHTESNETFRIISVRKGEKYEQETYFRSIQN